MFIIRPAVATDISDLISIDHTGKSDYVWQLDLRREIGQVIASFREVRLPRSVDVPYPHNPRTLEDNWSRRDLTLAVIHETAAAGYACVKEDRPSSSAWVTDLVIAPELRRKGAGSALMTEIQTWASDRGAGRLILEMQSKNHPCIRFAQKFGFEFCGYNDQYYATRDITLYFAMTIK